VGGWYTEDMSLFINQNSNRSKLQERLAAELQEKAKRKAQAGEVGRPDGVADSAYLKDTKQTSSTAWIWIVVILLLVGSVIYFAILK
jgi:hypothetical protein